MSLIYTTNLALAQPGPGTQDGVWGNDINNGLTSYLDIAIAGGLAITITTTDVTLTNTQGSNAGTNIGATTAQYAILNISGAMTGARSLIVPSSSKSYIIYNNTTGGYALTVKGAATTGVDLVNSEKAIVAWNGTDYIKISSSLINSLSGVLAIANGGTGQTTLAAASIATYAGTETLTNKRIDPRVVSAASASSLTPSIATADIYAYTALAANLTINAPTGTPLDGDKLMFRFLDNGTGRTLSWNGTYTVIGVTLPTTTTASKTTYVGCIYNANNTRWDVIAVTTQA